MKCWSLYYYTLHENTDGIMPKKIPVMEMALRMLLTFYAFGSSSRSKFLTVINDGHSGRCTSKAIVIRADHTNSKEFIWLWNEVIYDVNLEDLAWVISTECKVSPISNIVFTSCV